MAYQNIYSSYSYRPGAHPNSLPGGGPRPGRQPDPTPGSGNPPSATPDPLNDRRPPPAHNPRPDTTPPGPFNHPNVNPRGPGPYWEGGRDPGYASTASGPAGVGGTGGFGFTNMAQYMYANPMGNGMATTPTGMSSTDYNPAIGGFAPSGAYTPGMAGVDNALNHVYRNYPPDGGGGASAGAAAGNSGSSGLYQNIMRSVGY